MTTIDDLADEFSLAVCSVTPERLAALRAAGVSDAAFDPPMVGIAPIETYSSGLYEPRGDSDVGVILPVGEWDGINWQIEDLIAFYLNRPERWWRRLGVANVLGDINGFSNEPRRLHSRPLDWLKDGGCGLSILDWAVDPVDLLLGAGHLVADRSLLTRLRKASIKAATGRMDTVIPHG